jgi:hypothetical protein
MGGGFNGSTGALIENVHHVRRRDMTLRDVRFLKFLSPLRRLLGEGETERDLISLPLLDEVEPPEPGR